MRGQVESIVFTVKYHRYPLHRQHLVNPTRLSAETPYFESDFLTEK